MHAGCGIVSDDAKELQITCGEGQLSDPVLQAAVLDGVAQMPGFRPNQ
jgi:hypothetical protein